jgi:fumarylacetoacetate (FAA) hydrolase family protein
MKLTEYTSNGYEFQLVVRDGDIAIFKGTKPDRVRKGVLENWEVIKIQRVRKDHKYPNGEILLAGTEHAPNNNSWGTNGWTCSNYNHALEKYNSLIELDSVKLD